jgi:hypothetical protein
MADTIARDEAARVRDELAQALDRSGLPSEPKALELGTLLGCAYPSFRATLASRPDDWFALATAGTKAARDHRIYRRLLQAGLDSPEGQTLEGVRRLL